MIALNHGSLAQFGTKKLATAAAIKESTVGYHTMFTIH